MERHDSSLAVPPLSSANGDAPALAAALKQSHIDIEAEKNALARTLHDEIGGLLVGVTMDMGWIASQPGLADTVKEKLARAQALMRAAIDMARELVEDLKPTLLENVGLYPTLRWHMKASCKAVSVPYTESFPETEAPMTPEVRIGVFRIFQEALKDVLSQRNPTGLSMRVEVIEKILHCHLIHQSEGWFGNAAHSASPETSMRLRAQRVGGTLQWSRTINGRHLHLRVPLISSDAYCPQE
jgi:signal transduction histidine kinase